MQNIEKEMKIYGMPKQEVLAEYDEIKPRYAGHEYIYIMGILSDAQEVMQMGQLDTARQFINKAKLLISQKGHK